MARTERIRRLVRLAPWTALLLGIGCGGDKNPAGPGGGQDVVDYELVSLGTIELPADVAAEDCENTRFYSGRLQLPEEGRWRIRLEVNDFTGDWGYLDEGDFTDDGDVVWLHSDWSGATYQGTVDGSELKLPYDWCYNGVTDVQLVFDR